MVQISNFLFSTAWGQAAGAATPAKPSLLESLFPFAVILLFFWLFMARPQQKKLKDHQTLLTNLKRGDQVITNGGIYGEITGITEKVITLQVADNVRIKVAKNQISGLAAKEL